MKKLHSLPIAPTPVLRGKEAEEFHKKINNKKLWGSKDLINTPKLDIALREIRKI